MVDFLQLMGPSHSPDTHRDLELKLTMHLEVEQTPFCRF